MARAWPSDEELTVQRLGGARHRSPIAPGGERFVDDGARVLLASDSAEIDELTRAGRRPPGFELAGPRRELFFDPARLACGIVTCGGLCPGLNNVVRSLVLRLTYAYGVKRILGFRYGYAGLAPEHGHEPLVLEPAAVDSIHEQGGTLLGTSRGPQDVGVMVDRLVALDIGVLFVLGGDGGLRGAAAIVEEITRRGLPIAVVGVPKTIDNDLAWTRRSFGFVTAVEAARGVIQAAHTEARAVWNGIGLVKLMGRHSGFIAAHATLANSDVNFCLVPEVQLVLEGGGHFLDALARRLELKHHAVVVVAEGAGQTLLQGSGAPELDESGNVRLKDVGRFLRERIGEHFAANGQHVIIRYFDPSYLIRSQPAGSFDAQFCLILAQHAVHAAMSGRTNMLVGWWNDHMVHVPIPLAVRERRQLDPHGEEWQRVLESTGQPASMTA